MEVSHYLWPEKESLLEQIDICKLQSGRMEATIYAPANASGNPRLAEIPRLLEEAGFETRPDTTAEGRAVLTVMNFKKPEQIFKVLAENGIVTGERTSHLEGKEKPRSLREILKAKGPNLASVSGIVGHVGLILSGLYTNEKKLVLTGAFYGAANLFQAAFGNGKAGGELQEAAKEMRDLLAKNGITMPETISFSDADMQKHDGLLSKMLNFCQSHPMVITNVLGLTGNVLLTLADDTKKQGTAKLADDNQLMKAWTKISGISSALAALTIIFVPEKEKVNPHKRIVLTPEEQAAELKDGSVFKSITDKVRENPLRVAGPLLLVSDAAMVARAGMKFSENQKDYAASTDPKKSWANAHVTSGFSALTAAGWVGSGAFTTLSSKEPPKDYSEEEVQEHLVTTAAIVLMKTPKEVRDKAIVEVADYLVKRPDIIETKEEIISHINKRVADISQSPWQNKLTSEKFQSMAAGQQHSPAYT